MPNPGADRPLRKVTLNLYEDDCVELERHHGHGWTTEVREVIYTHTTMCIRSLRLKRTKLLGDYTND